MSETFRTSIDITATPEKVFDHFVKPELLVRWMGDFVRLEAIDGGLFSVDINGPNEAQDHEHLRGRTGQGPAVLHREAGVPEEDGFQCTYRWLTVASPEEPDGPELHLESNASPVAKAYQQGLCDQGTAAAMFYVSDIEADYDRLSKLGVKFTMPVTKTTGSRIAMLDDSCGNLIQLTQLEWG